MTDFKNVASGDHVPGSTGAVLGPSVSAAGVGKYPVPMRGFFAVLGNVGTGDPVFQAYVQRVEGGTWLPVNGASVTNNGSKEFYAFGVAMRVLVPTLTDPGTGTTAPRVAFTAENLQVPRHNMPQGTVAGQYFGNDQGSTAEIGSLPGYGRLNPDAIQGAGTPFKSLCFLTQEGSGTTFIESTYRDGDGDFEIQEGAALSAAGQVAVVSYGEEHHLDFTDGAGTTDVWLDVFQMPV